MHCWVNAGARCRVSARRVSPVMNQMSPHCCRCLTGSVPLAAALQDKCVYERVRGVSVGFFTCGQTALFLVGESQRVIRHGVEYKPFEQGVFLRIGTSVVRHECLDSTVGIKSFRLLLGRIEIGIGYVFLSAMRYSISWEELLRAICCITRRRVDSSRVSPERSRRSLAGRVMYGYRRAISSTHSTLTGSEGSRISSVRCSRGEDAI